MAEAEASTTSLGRIISPIVAELMEQIASSRSKPWEETQVLRCTTVPKEIPPLEFESLVNRINESVKCKVVWLSADHADWEYEITVTLPKCPPDWVRADDEADVEA